MDWFGTYYIAPFLPVPRRKISILVIRSDGYLVPVRSKLRVDTDQRPYASLQTDGPHYNAAKLICEAPSQGTEY